MSLKETPSERRYAAKHIKKEMEYEEATNTPAKYKAYCNKLDDERKEQENQAKAAEKRVKDWNDLVEKVGLNEARRQTNPEAWRLEQLKLHPEKARYTDLDKIKYDDDTLRAIAKYHFKRASFVCRKCGKDDKK
jgi:hypothetical protein